MKHPRESGESPLVGQRLAFTIVELLVVLAIISVIFGIAASAGYRMMATTRAHTMTLEKRAVLQAMIAYRTASLDSDHQPIAAQEGPPAGRIGAEDGVVPPFSSYLRGPTEFYYTWSEGGKDLRVYRTPDLDSESY